MTVALYLLRAFLFILIHLKRPCLDHWPTVLFPSLPTALTVQIRFQLPRSPGSLSPGTNSFEGLLCYTILCSHPAGLVHHALSSHPSTFFVLPLLVLLLLLQRHFLCSHFLRSKPGWPTRSPTGCQQSQSHYLLLFQYVFYSLPAYKPLEDNIFSAQKEGS